MSKVDGRTRDRADLNLRDSLERLRVDHLDVLMLHGLSYPDEVEQVFAPGGAMQTLLGAQRAGVARYIGFSAHRSSAVAVEALRRHDFDMVLAPVNPADYLIDDFTAALLPFARDRGTALMGMKALASGALPDTATAIRWALSQPWHTVTVGVSSREHVAIDVAAATDFSPLPPQQQADIVNRWRTYATPDRYYWRSGPGRIS
jgi:aryl-alcohol dehydrogenase-like predicted oxidoreductase